MQIFCELMENVSMTSLVIISVSWAILTKYRKINFFIQFGQEPYASLTGHVRERKLHIRQWPSWWIKATEWSKWPLDVSGQFHQNIMPANYRLCTESL